MGTRKVTYTVKHGKNYGFWHLLLDFVLVLATGGLWLIWILIRFLRNA